LMQRLREMSAKGFAGDFKNFDGQEVAELMEAMCIVVNNWYDDGPENAQIRRVLIGEAFDRYTIVHDGVVHIDQGLPSGFILTVIFNSWINEIYKYLAWLDLAPVNKKALTTCDANVASITYGDDNGHAVKEETLEFFNLRTIGAFLSKHGITYTDEHKNHWSIAEPSVDIMSISFLKRLFVPHPQYPLFLRAPLEKKSIEDRLLWITKSKFASPDELLQDNITSSMQDAYQWGTEYFYELRDKIESALEVIGKEHLMAEVSYDSEDYNFMCTMRGMKDCMTNPLVKSVIGV